MADISGFTVSSTDFNAVGGITISGSYSGGGSSSSSTNDEDIVLQVKLDNGDWVNLTGTWDWDFGSYSWQKNFSFELDSASLARLKDGSAISNLGNAAFRFYDKETSTTDGDNFPASAVNVTNTGDLDSDATTFTKAINTPKLTSFNLNPGGSGGNASDLTNNGNGLTLRGAFKTTGYGDDTESLEPGDYELYAKLGSNGTWFKVTATLTFSSTGTFTAVITQANGASIAGNNNVIFQLKNKFDPSIAVTEDGSTQFTITCFYPGTMIATTEGEKAVETLAIGDMLLRRDGSVSPIRWMGRSTVSTRFADKMKALPIRIRKDALAENVPSRDLLVSPDHAIFIDGVLAQAGALVNGTSIVREANVPTVFSYYHVELADHALIMAENTATESFVDNVDRMSFDNWAEHEALFGDLPAIQEMDLPRAKSQRQVPSATRKHLADRAVELGYSAVDAAVA